MATQDLIIGTLERIKERITANIRTSGEWASGKTAESMRIEAKDNGGTLYGRPDFWNLEEGSEPSPEHRYPANFEQVIYEWMDAKGIAPSDEYEHVTVAQCIAWFIRKNGTRLYRDGGRDDIYSTVIEEELDNLRKELVINAKSEIAKYL